MSLEDYRTARGGTARDCACGSPLDRTTIDGVSLSACARCGGCFLAVDDVVSVTSSPERTASFLRALLDALKSRDPLGTPPRKEHCPICERRLSHRMRYLASNATVWICADHGIWFEPGQLASILSQRRQRMDALAHAAKHPDAVVGGARLPLRLLLAIGITFVVALIVEILRS